MKNLKKAFYQDYYSDFDFLSDRDTEKAGDFFEKKNKELLKIYPKRKEVLETLSIGTLLKAQYGDRYQQIPLKTTYPGLLISSGYIHNTNGKKELTLGFYFDHTTGLPVIPGSSVKGVLRSAFPNFDKKGKYPMQPKWHEASDLQRNKAEYICSLARKKFKTEKAMYIWVHRLEIALFEGINIDASIANKNSEKEKKIVYLPPFKKNKFLDAHLTKSAVNKAIIGSDSLTPHGDNPLKNPTPLPFIKVLPNRKFGFQFLLFPISIKGKPVSIKAQRELFKKILLDLGIGAKTNVGYGQLVEA